MSCFTLFRHKEGTVILFKGGGIDTGTRLSRAVLYKQEIQYRSACRDSDPSRRQRELVPLLSDAPPGVYCG